MGRALSKFSIDAPDAPIVLDVKPKPNGEPVKEVSDLLLEELVQSDHAGSVCIQVSLPKKQKQKIESLLREFVTEYVYCSLDDWVRGC